MNRLSRATSPYLKQHADNPVNWYEWGEEALSRAKTEDKPLIISIGYAACHWCHVMASESFSDRAIASFMNEHFICIKVDREERPDIDQIYMEAAFHTSGRGGWPLNAFALPDGKPFFAATYFPPKQWIELLHQISNVYLTDSGQVREAAGSITEGIRSIPFNTSPAPEPFVKTDYLTSGKNQIALIDPEWGGYKGAPKFLMPSGIEFLLQFHYLAPNSGSLNESIITLDAMAKGGIYDQIGGGFSRYSTDPFWKVPHFEKMLYDNAQMIGLYSHAFQITNKQRYADIIKQTIQFAERELLQPDGGFSSSIDADSEHEEGKFYLWTKKEIEAILGQSLAEIILPYYQVTEEGNWEHGTNILHIASEKDDFACKYGIPVKELERILKKSNRLLLQQRNKRIRPTTDKKILASWNALMVSGYIQAYHALGKPKYLAGALKTADFLESKMVAENGMLFHTYSEGEATTAAFLDDYALLATACIDLYEATFNLHWLTLAKRLTGFVEDHFSDPHSNLFFYTSDQTNELIARKHDFSDNVIPSSNSVLSHVFYKLAILFENGKYRQTAEKMVSTLRNEIVTQGVYHSNWAMLLGKLVFPSHEIAILGEKALPFCRLMKKDYLPTTVFAGGTDENLPLLKHRSIPGKTAIYVCRDKTCTPPVWSAKSALTRIWALLLLLLPNLAGLAQIIGYWAQ